MAQQSRMASAGLGTQGLGRKRQSLSALGARPVDRQEGQERLVAKPSWQGVRPSQGSVCQVGVEGNIQEARRHHLWSNRMALDNRRHTESNGWPLN